VAEPRLDLEGPAAPPRQNGELVFEAPWQSRLFGLTMALCQAGTFEWEEFRRLLIEEIGTFDASGAPSESYSYYAHWQRAFERLLASKGVCAPAELDARARVLAARPPGHDHDHEHGHSHEHGHDRSHDRGG
jgi:nitrile hydratase accessory protein